MNEIRAIMLAIPCFNEAGRFAAAGFGEFLRDERVRLVLVDDGSTDDTARVLAAFADTHDRVEVIRQPRNLGKGEAVRAGMAAGIAAGADVVGFADADGATPVTEVQRLIARLLEREDVDAVIGSRVAVLGSRINRRARRHYVGRVFATAASLVLRSPIYDTQCGAKVFRVGPPLTAALDTPFASRWAFDVELLGRLLAADGRVLEEPLLEWNDVPGSKISPPQMMRAAVDLISINRRLSKLR